MSKHIPTKAQEIAFKKVVKAIKELRKLGLAVYAKQCNLVAYTKAADQYAQEFSPLHKMGKYGAIPCLSEPCFTDSGADDYATYISTEDQAKFNS